MNTPSKSSPLLSAILGQVNLSHVRPAIPPLTSDFTKTVQRRITSEELAAFFERETPSSERTSTCANCTVEIPQILSLLDKIALLDARINRLIHLRNSLKTELTLGQR